MRKTLTYSDLLELGENDVIYFPKGTKIRDNTAHRAVHDGLSTYMWRVEDEHGVVQFYLSSTDVAPYSPFVEDEEDIPQGVEMEFVGEGDYSIIVEIDYEVPLCEATSKHDWICTIPPGHSGPHISTTGEGELCSIWTTGPDQVQITTFDIPKPKQDDGWENATLIDVNGSIFFRGFGGDRWYDEDGHEHSKDDLLGQTITILYAGPDTAA